MKKRRDSAEVAEGAAAESTQVRDAVDVIVAAEMLGRTGLKCAGRGECPAMPFKARDELPPSASVASFKKELKAENASSSEAVRNEIAASLRAVTKLGGEVELVSAGTLPNDGKVIADERPVG